MAPTPPWTASPSWPEKGGSAVDVSPWRKAECERLLALRQGLGPEYRATQTAATAAGLDDGQGYRLGYGGGFFDRRLALARPRPLVIGIGYLCAAIRTTFPQAHDIPMNRIITGSE